MKTNLFIPVLLTALTLVSCSKILGTETNTEETMDNVKALVKENVTDKGMSLITLQIMPQKPLTNKADLIYLMAADKNGKFRELTFLFDMGSYTPRGDKEIDSSDIKAKMGDMEDGAGIKSIDMESIPSNTIANQVEEAKKQLPEGLEFKGVGTYEITMKEGKPVTKFKIQVTETGNSTKIKGKRIETSYYEFDCVVGDDGNVSIVVE